MIDENKLNEAEKNFARYVEDNWVFTNRKDIADYAHFFLKNAETSIMTAKVLFELSSENDKKMEFRLQIDFETYLWVVVSAYYSMFYSALALLAKNDIKVGEKLVHKVVEDTLIAKFLKNKKLAKLFENYGATKEQAMQIIGNEQKAKELIENFAYERNKRHELQYELGSLAKQNLAKTSLLRATEFVAEIRNILRE